MAGCPELRLQGLRPAEGGREERLGREPLRVRRGLLHRARKNPRACYLYARIVY
jgi:hypothetical protein